eukprot:NODE_1770_length_1412_cov_41.121790_g1599_i0.p2 GENE.NODE_1770_length_1412_cov_41.121790_g1599_i0~~NODE_1770_length_1412_cov_41.121790_g1599_i0.p2  ORF type:complete len:161 (+),score=23.76 NODE_1770_length_1412_cov_41.121790_g1599_i0:747-1229(+)
MADADGATRFSDIESLLDTMQRIEVKGLGCVCGSRRHLVNSETVAKRTFFRNLLMRLFHICVSFTFFFGNGSHGLDDTQCGFKLFSRKCAELVFPRIHSERWCFDVELLLVARHYEVPTSEVSVNWQEIPGSKLNPLGMLHTGLECLLMAICYRFRIWRA